MVLNGTPPFCADLPSASKACIASGTNIAAFFIRACMVHSSLIVAVIVRTHSLLRRMAATKCDSRTIPAQLSGRVEDSDVEDSDVENGDSQRRVLREWTDARR